MNNEANQLSQEKSEYRTELERVVKKLCVLISALEKNPKLLSKDGNLKEWLDAVYQSNTHSITNKAAAKAQASNPDYSAEEIYITCNDMVEATVLLQPMYIEYRGLFLPKHIDLITGFIANSIGGLLKIKSKDATDLNEENTVRRERGGDKKFSLKR